MKTFLKENKDFVISLLFAIVGILIFSREYSSGHWFWKKTVNGTPNFSNGLCGLAFLIVLWIRGILDFRGKNKYIVIVNIVVDLTMFTTLFALIKGADDSFFNDLKKDITLACFVVFFITMLLFGMKGLAKIVTVLGLAVLVCRNINLVSELMGLNAYVGFVCYIIAFYLQEGISFRELKRDLILLYSKSSVKIKAALNEASDDAQRLGKAASSVASAATGVPVDKMMQDVYSENKNG